MRGHSQPCSSWQYVIGCSLGLYKPILMTVFVIPSRTSISGLTHHHITHRAHTQTLVFLIAVLFIYITAFFRGWNGWNVFMWFVLFIGTHIIDTTQRRRFHRLL
jgi:hypothetical protein